MQGLLAYAGQLYRRVPQILDRKKSPNNRDCTFVSKNLFNCHPIFCSQFKKKFRSSKCSVYSSYLLFWVTTNIIIHWSKLSGINNWSWFASTFSILLVTCDLNIQLIYQHHLQLMIYRRQYFGLAYTKFLEWNQTKKLFLSDQVYFPKSKQMIHQLLNFWSKP